MDSRAAKEYILQRLRTELKSNRTYHSLAHTLDVYASVIDIAEKEGITGEGIELLKTAAVFHDSGFLVQDLDHENASCVLAQEALPRFGFDPQQVAQVCTMIMATRVPQQPQDRLSRILCDADLDYLGREDFESTGDLLFQELKCYGVLKTLREWNELQVLFLSGHQYFTETNTRSREPVKAMHLKRLQDWLGEEH